MMEEWGLLLNLFNMRNFLLIVLMVVGVASTSCNKGMAEKSKVPLEYSREIVDSKDIKSILSDLHNDSKVELRWDWLDNVWEKVKQAWNWVKSHYGTYLWTFCKQNWPCGPCPGFCINLYGSGGNGDNENGDNNNKPYYMAIPDSDSTLTTVEQNSYLELYKLTLINNTSTGNYKLLFEFNEQSHFITSDSTLIIQSDTYLGESENNLASFTNFIGVPGHIVVEAGKYPLFYNSSTQRFETVVDFYID